MFLLVGLIVSKVMGGVVGGLQISWDSSTNCTTFYEDYTEYFYPDGECVNPYQLGGSIRLDSQDKGETIQFTTWENLDCDKEGEKGYSQTYKTGQCYGHPGYYYWSEMYTYGPLTKQPDQYFIYAYGNDSQCSSDKPLLPLYVQRSGCLFSDRLFDESENTITEKIFCDENQRLKVTFYDGWCESEIATAFLNETCTQLRIAGYDQYVIRTCKELY